MAVEAHRLLLAGGHRQQLPSAGWPWAGADEDRCATARPSQHHHQQQQQEYRLQNASCVGVGLPAPQVSSAAAPAPMAQYAAGGQMFLGDAAESDVTFGGGAAARHEVTAMATAAPRRRKRAEQQEMQTPTPPVFEIGAADVAAHFQQHIVDVDRLVLQYIAKMWAALTELRRRHIRQVVAAVESSAAKRLRAREEEVQRMVRINGALEERVSSLYVEAQLWRDLAQSNEATANALRGELEQALDAQQTRAAGAGSSTADDAGSCCRGGNDVAADEARAAGAAEDDGETGTPLARTCAMCGQSAADVLMLPCRHLCACAPCAGAARACPACGCAKNGSVCVNFS